MASFSVQSREGEISLQIIISKLRSKNLVQLLLQMFSTWLYQNIVIKGLFKKNYGLAFPKIASPLFYVQTLDDKNKWRKIGDNRNCRHEAQESQLPGALSWSLLWYLLFEMNNFEHTDFHTCRRKQTVPLSYNSIIRLLQFRLRNKIMMMIRVGIFPI